MALWPSVLGKAHSEESPSAYLILHPGGWTGLSFLKSWRFSWYMPPKWVPKAVDWHIHESCNIT